MAVKNLNIERIMKACDNAKAITNAKKKDLFGEKSTSEERFLQAYKNHIKSIKK